MLRKGRMILSSGMLLVMVLTFGGLLAPVLPHWQFLPALLAGNVLALALILAVTFLFGRVYCSVLCPLGIGQDLVIWLSVRSLLHANGAACATLSCCWQDCPCSLDIRSCSS